MAKGAAHLPNSFPKCQNQHGGFSKSRLPDTTQKVFCREGLWLGASSGCRIGEGSVLLGSSAGSYDESGRLFCSPCVVCGSSPLGPKLMARVPCFSEDVPRARIGIGFLAPEPSAVNPKLQPRQHKPSNPEPETHLNNGCLNPTSRETSLGFLGSRARATPKPRCVLLAAAVGSRPCEACCFGLSLQRGLD